jgi:AcrR family transcriptional regulator
MTPVTTTPLVQETRELILDAAERLLGHYGYKKTTMEDVAREAGIGKGTTYLHFPGKEEVALAVIDRIGDRLLTRLRAIACSGGSCAGRLRRMLLTRILYRLDLVRGYAHSVDDMVASVRPAYLERRWRFLDVEAAVFAEIIDEGRRDNVFICDDALLTAHTLLWATNSLLPSSLSPKERARRKEVEDKTARIADLLLSGLLRRGPAKATRRAHHRAAVQLEKGES